MMLKYLHTMVRVKDLEASMAFYRLLGLRKRGASTMKRAASRWSSWPRRDSPNARWN
jgi:catechol 2,3-dioxygenase-like lactoylglutathione lyase family enzyme